MDEAELVRVVAGAKRTPEMDALDAEYRAARPWIYLYGAGDIPCASSRRTPARRYANYAPVSFRNPPSSSSWPDPRARLGTFYGLEVVDNVAIVRGTPVRILVDDGSVTWAAAARQLTSVPDELRALLRAGVPAADAVAQVHRKALNSSAEAASAWYALARKARLEAERHAERRAAQIEAERHADQCAYQRTDQRADQHTDQHAELCADQHADRADAITYLRPYTDEVAQAYLLPFEDERPGPSGDAIDTASDTGVDPNACFLLEME